MPPTTTLVGWVTIIGVGVLVYYVYFKKPAKSTQLQASKLAAKTAEKRKEPKKLRKTRKDDGQSGRDVEKSQKEDYTIVAKEVSRENDEVDNHEFAKQMSSAKAGTFMAAKPQEGARQRSIKQSRTQEKPAVVETSSDNGTAGADADDDRSSFTSPELGATKLTSPVVNSDVSDMLEARAPGPSVLRITSPTTPALPSKTKPASAFEQTETKKQRQNRKKADAKKLAREEEEKERKVLLEKQRRTAREAEGRAAKDGSTFMATKAPSSSAWTAPAVALNDNNGVKTAANTARVDLLDTYDHPDQSNVKVTAPQENYSESELAGSDWQKLASSVSEEEQMRRALEDSDSWKTVGKEKRNRNKTQPPLLSKPEDKQSSNDEHSDYAPPPLIAPTGAGQEWNVTLVSQKSDGEFEERETEVQDSEWEVA